MNAPGRYLPLSLRLLVVGKPLPLDVWSPHGVLLLARGQTIASHDQLRKLAAMQPMVRENDLSILHSRDWLRAGTNRVARTAYTGYMVDRLWLDPIQAWPELYDRIAALMDQPEALGVGFQHAIEELYRHLVVAITGHEEQSLFLLVHMLQKGELRYSALNALACATFCHLGALAEGAQLDTRRTLCCAALTMNIGMTRLQDRLSLQRAPLTADQHTAVDTHATQGVRVLRGLGVQDTTWLNVVQCHHQHDMDELTRQLGTGWAPWCILLQLVDRTVARVSPRAYRPGQHPSLAMREIFRSAQDHEQPIAQRMVKVFGLYPPGCYVRLRNQETAVVIRRGRAINKPLVASILNHRGDPLTSPQVRDTSLTDYAIDTPIASTGVQVDIDPRRLLQRV